MQKEVKDLIMGLLLLMVIISLSLSFEKSIWGISIGFISTSIAFIILFELQNLIFPKNKRLDDIYFLTIIALITLVCLIAVSSIFFYLLYMKPSVITLLIVGYWEQIDCYLDYLVEKNCKEEY
jgi:hypothetical protein